MIAPVPVDLGGAIREGERLLRRILGEDVLLTVEVEEPLWPVLCDRAQLEQVIVNLVVNARDAMPDGGKLEISARNACPHHRVVCGLLHRRRPSKGEIEAAIANELAVRDSALGAGGGDDSSCRSDGLQVPCFPIQPKEHGTQYLFEHRHLYLRSRSQVAIARVRRQGPGLSFYYYAPSSTLVQINIATVDVPFVFTETSSDFQAVVVQGQLSYRIADPATLAANLDFSLDARGHYASDDPQKLDERLVNIARVLSNEIVRKLPLRDALTAFEPIGAHILTEMRTHQVVRSLGIEILAASILSIAPTPEMSKALEAESREAIQRKSDEAVYARRNAAVEQERRIKESELNTELLVEEKQRQKREAHLAGEVTLEQQRATLIERKSENDRKQPGHAHLNAPRRWPSRARLAPSTVPGGPAGTGRRRRRARSGPRGRP